MRVLGRVCSSIVTGLMVLSVVQAIRMLMIPTALLTVAGAWAFVTNLRSGAGRNQRRIAAALQVVAVLLPIASVALALSAAESGRPRSDMMGLSFIVAAVTEIVMVMATIEGVRLAREAR